MHNILTWIENRVRQTSIAVSEPSGQSSFHQLRGRAMQIASALAEKGGNVAIYLPKGADFITAMLGSLYASCVYVPLDVRSPIARSLQILDIVSAAAVITDEKGAKSLISAGVSEALILVLDTLDGPVNEALAKRSIEGSIETDPVCILFTSGSTGVPKGVIVPHRRIINYINWAVDTFKIDSTSVVGNQAPFFFTVSIMDIYLCLATGARLCPIPENLFAKPQKLLDYMIKEGINHTFWVSSAYHNLAVSGILEEGPLPALRYAWFVGEPMHTDSLNRWIKAFPESQFANLYGSTETDMTIYHVFEKGRAVEKIPLGKACANTEVFLLDENDRPAPTGEIGQICVRGPALALGYYKYPEQTAFTQNPLHSDYPETIYRTGDLAEYDENGLLIFHGRRDHQFKHLGYRIESGEIEAAAEHFDGISEACAIYDGEKRQIALFYAPQGLNEALLRKHFLSTLPIYMIPTRYTSLNAIPHNANGKKDRVSLKKQFIESE